MLKQEADIFVSLRHIGAGTYEVQLCRVASVQVNTGKSQKCRKLFLMESKN